jgi:hypothetical protein
MKLILHHVAPITLLFSLNQKLYPTEKLRKEAVRLFWTAAKAPSLEALYKAVQAIFEFDDLIVPLHWSRVPAQFRGLLPTESVQAPIANTRAARGGGNGRAGNAAKPTTSSAPVAASTAAAAKSASAGKTLSALLGLHHEHQMPVAFTREALKAAGDETVKKTGHRGLSVFTWSVLFGANRGDGAHSTSAAESANSVAKEVGGFW